MKPLLPGVAALSQMCLDHLVAEPETLGRFMVETGYDPATLRRSLGTDEFHAAIIDYFARNEPMMLVLCAANGIRPEDFMTLWHRLNPAA